MHLNRALELCQLPLDQSRSHEVKIDRFAVIHVLADRVEQVAARKAAESQLEIEKAHAINLEKQVAEMQILFGAESLKVKDLERQLKTGDDLIANRNAKIEELEARLTEVQNGAVNLS